MTTNQSAINRKEKIAQMVCIYLNDHRLSNRQVAYRTLKTLVSEQCISCVQFIPMNNARGHCNGKRKDLPCIVMETHATENKYWNNLTL